MGRSKFIDVAATTQILGSLLKNPSLLDQEDKYWFMEEDFPDEFHRVVFGCIYQISKVNSSALSVDSIIDFYIYLKMVIVFDLEMISDFFERFFHLSYLEILIVPFEFS